MTPRLIALTVAQVTSSFVKPPGNFEVPCCDCGTTLLLHPTSNDMHLAGKVKVCCCRCALEAGTNVVAPMPCTDADEMMWRRCRKEFLEKN